MTTAKYLDLVKTNCIDYVLDDEDNPNAKDLEVIQVWYCKTVQNHKGLFIIKNNLTNIIYPYFIEATYNGDNHELYLDYYTKQFKTIVNCDYDYKVTY